MSKPPNTAAREYLTPSEQSLLEQYGVTSAEFNRVSGREHGSEREETSLPGDDGSQREGTSLPGDDGSQMVKEDRPEPKNKPSAELARDVDREAFEKKWAEELERAAEAQTPGVEHDNERDLDYDR